MSDSIATPAPHNRAMLYLLIALLPAAGVGVYFFGVRALVVILVTVVSSVVFEAGYQFFTKKPVTINDLSAVITGLLLALTLPPNVPLWIPVVGAFVAIIIVKQIFGGLGKNFLNPALAARGFLTVSYGASIADGFTYPLSGFWATDTMASATPLARINTAEIPPVMDDYISALFGNIPGAIGETAAIVLVLGGLFLVITKTIPWQVPVSFIGTVFVLTYFMGEYADYQLLLGGLLLGSIFMATDPSSTPATWIGKLIFGIGCGVMTALIRLIGGYPEGVVFAILLMNLFTPLIDRFIKPRPKVKEAN